MKIRYLPLDEADSRTAPGRSERKSCMDEIELLDGASAEFDQELVDQGRTVSGILRICPDQLRCGDFPEAFPEDDHLRRFREKQMWD